MLQYLRSCFSFPNCTMFCFYIRLGIKVVCPVPIFMYNYYWITKSWSIVLQLHFFNSGFTFWIWVWGIGDQWKFLYFNYIRTFWQENWFTVLFSRFILTLQDMSVRIAQLMRLMLTHQVRCVFTTCNTESMLSCYLDRCMLDNNCWFLLLWFLNYQTAEGIYWILFWTIKSWEYCSLFW